MHSWDLNRENYTIHPNTTINSKYQIFSQKSQTYRKKTWMTFFTMVEWRRPNPTQVHSPTPTTSNPNYVKTEESPKKEAVSSGDLCEWTWPQQLTFAFYFMPFCNMCLYYS